MDTAEAEFSLLMWMLGALVAGLSAQLAHGWLRTVDRGERPWRQWRPLLLATVVLGLGLGSALELGLQAQAFPFAVGYRWQALACLPVAALLTLPAVAVLAASARTGALLLSGALLGAAVLTLQLGWIWAAGFQPGLVWQHEWSAIAALGLVAGLAVAQWMALDESFRDGPRRQLWRLGASALTALSVMLAEQGMALASGLHEQVASAYVDDMPGTLVSLVNGVVVPLILVALLLDLWLRRRQHRERRRLRGHDHFQPTPRRKRRHKMRTL